MKEKVAPTTDQRRELIFRYANALHNALQLERQINIDMSTGNRITYFIIEDATRRSSCSLEIGEDLVRIAQGAAFGAYCELAFKPDRQINEETGEEIKVIDPNGKAAADYIIKDLYVPRV